MTEENKDLFDLGSDTTEVDFDPFAADEETAENPVADAPAKAQETKPAKDSKDSKAEQAAEQPLDEKPPVFEYAGATENIDDTSKTFDELRIEKSADFPELEDGKRVSWTVEYGKVTKTVGDPKGTSIGKMKSDIEASKEFTDSLKKPRADKNPTCKVKPRVTAQSKGQEVGGATSSYRGVFASVEDAEVAGKVISIVPARDGKVYEIRNTEMGKFITPVKFDFLSDVKAGFIPAPGIPKIPMYIMLQVVSLFRHYTQNGSESEVLVNIYWDKREQKFIADVPGQIVTKVSITTHGSLEYANERYIHYMDIHSHNSMKAFFSPQDDADEKGTRLYTVIGRLDKYFPTIKTRISNGGKFHEIDPAEVFELVSCPFPDEWKENVHLVVKYPKQGDVEWRVHGDDEKDENDGYLYGYDDSDMPKECSDLHEVDNRLHGADGEADNQSQGDDAP